jgi:hypothetical protein
LARGQGGPDRQRDRTAFAAPGIGHRFFSVSFPGVP